MTLDFPASPTDGQTYGNFIWSASTGAWKAKPSVSTTTIHSSAIPTTANAGDVWFNTNTGVSFTYYDDGTSKQWVEMVSSSVPAANTIMPSGTIVQTARATSPDGWFLCQGQAISRTTYATLYAAIGTSYGSGDGSTTFNIPDLQGRVAVGKNSGTFASLGATGGTETVTLTIAQMPSHTHIQNSHNHIQDAHNHNHRQWIFNGAASSGTHYGFGYSSNTGAANDTTAASSSGEVQYGNYPTTATNQATTATNQNTGGDGSHNNLQPYIVLNYMIKV